MRLKGPCWTDFFSTMLFKYSSCAVGKLRNKLISSVKDIHQSKAFIGDVSDEPFPMDIWVRLRGGQWIGLIASQARKCRNESLNSCSGLLMSCCPFVKSSSCEWVQSRATTSMDSTVRLSGQLQSKMRLSPKFYCRLTFFTERGGLGR